MLDAGSENTVNGHDPAAKTNGESTNFGVKAGLAKMLKGGVIMDVVNADQVRQSPLYSCDNTDTIQGPHC